MDQSSFSHTPPIGAFVSPIEFLRVYKNIKPTLGCN